MQERLLKVINICQNVIYKYINPVCREDSLLQSMEYRLDVFCSLSLGYDFLPQCGVSPFAVVTAAVNLA